MITLDEVRDYLKNYDGEPMNIMEICGSHTAAISKNGIPGLLSERIRLISGPGCPVCVTPSAYVDRLIEIAMTPGTTVCTFGDMLRIPGSSESLSMAKGEGASVQMVYSPFDMISLAKENPEHRYVFAAVGFETTTPVYALLMEQLVEEQITNVQLLTALKTMPPAVEWLCSHDAPVNGFIAPGHVCVVTGANAFVPLAERYGIPFGVAGFSGEELLYALYGIVKAHGQGKVMNFYPKAVTAEGNTIAQETIARYFEPCDAMWRGMGTIPMSGMVLREEYRQYDAGSRDLTEDRKKNQACSCDRVLMGKISPTECPLFGRVCTPFNPQGACMVSEEGSCHQYLVNHRER